MVATLRREGDEPPEYSNADDEFTVELHHGGFFVGHGSNKTYVNEKIDWFDHCEVDTWSVLCLEDLAFQLDYGRNADMKFHWLLPGKSLADGLRLVLQDSDTLVMASLLHKMKNFVVYVDHDNSRNASNWDDVVANPISTLPKVISPQKETYIPRRKGEKLSSFYADLPKWFGDGSGPSSSAAAEVMGGTDSEEDSEEDSDFVDSDYDVEADDDNLFVDNVDEEVTDEGVMKGKKLQARNRDRARRNRESKATDGSDVSSEEELQLPDSDGEGQERHNFKSFRVSDMMNPVFKIGMLFESVELLRKAVTEYSLRQRVALKFLRNEKKRYHAICESGCPWELYASKVEWEKVEANTILPPVYVRKPGRPPKSRRKQPEEVQGPNGPKLSKHGIIMHCRYCGEKGHNRATCSLRKAGVQPNIPSNADQTPEDEEVPQDDEELPQEDEEVPQEEMFSDDAHTSQVVYFFDESEAPTMTQLSMLSQLQEEASAERQINQGPLPNSTFIASSQPEARPVPPTTATIPLKRKAPAGNKAPAGKKAPLGKAPAGNKAPAGGKAAAAKKAAAPGKAAAAPKKAAAPGKAAAAPKKAAAPGKKATVGKKGAVGN